MSYKRYMRYLPVAIGVGLVLVVMLVVYVFRDAFQKPVSTKKQVQQITVLQPPPTAAAAAAGTKTAGTGNQGRKNRAT